MKKNKATIDPNRDFPYNQSGHADDCMDTVTARTVVSLFEKFNIESSITFHAGVNSITYPWGSVNHSKKAPIGGGVLAQGHLKASEEEVWRGSKAPDFNALSSVGSLMQKKAGAVAFRSKDPKDAEFDIK